MSRYRLSSSITGMGRKKILAISLSGVIVLLLAVVGILSWKYHQVSSSSQSDKNKETSARVIDEVSKIFLAPTNEQPTVALIQDKSKLGNQQFFSKAQNGDYLLVYKTNKMALIY